MRRRLLKGALTLPGTEVPDDFRLVAQKVRATSIPAPPVKGMDWTQFETEKEEEVP